MTPKEYLDRYTSLDVPDPNTGFTTTVNITGYGSGWGPEEGCNRTDVGPVCNQEYNTRFVPALRVAHHGRNTPIGSTQFYFNQNSVGDFQPTEDFYVSSFVNAFVGKGSPDEITDTLRVALAVGRVGAGPDAAGGRHNAFSLQQYVDTYITLDCNGLVGNYYGIDPNTAVKSYANVGRRRLRARDVQVGDAVVTIPTLSKKFEHVALIEYWQCIGDTDDTGTALIKIVEWGEAGDETVHYTGDNPRQLPITFGPDRTYGVGFSTEEGKFRYIFAPPQLGDPRGW